MAVLTRQQIVTMRARVYRLGQGKEEIKAMGAVPSSTAWRLIFQAIEDRFASNHGAALIDLDLSLDRVATPDERSGTLHRVLESDKGGFKAALDTAYGRTTTGAVARVIAAAWVAERARR